MLIKNPMLYTNIIPFLFCFPLTIFYFILFYFCLLSYRATPVAYGGSQAWDLTGAVAAGLHHSHSNARSKPLL